MNRKTFLKSSFAIFGLSAIGLSTFLESCKKANTYPGPTVNFTLDLTASANAPLANVGGYVYNSGVIIIKVSTTVISALSQQCTNDGCTVIYNPVSLNVVCTCDNCAYGVNGNILAGPAPNALKKYTVTQTGTTLTIKG